MRIVKTIGLWLMRVVATIVLVATLAVVVTSVSPIYNFAKLCPFFGPDIYNPYANIDSAYMWRRANFHTHTRVEGPLNECDYWPEEVANEYLKYGYDIVTFSNHNEITEHPTLSGEAVSLYEHGYNLFKSHNLVFGAEQVCRYDMLLPLSVSQRQFMLDMLCRDADIVQMNHPLRTIATTDEHLRLLEGYTLIELDSGRSTENEYWDVALSAGHYVLGVANDDLHYPDRSASIAVRSNFLATPSLSYDDVLSTLRAGCFYAMRTPDYGAGEWQEKVRRNAMLPTVTGIGLRGDSDSVYIELSSRADSIKFVGSDHRTLCLAKDTDSASFLLGPDEPFVRITAYFPDGEVIYTNPFARYDSAVADSPRRRPSHTINWPYTLLFNSVLVVVAIGLILLYIRVVSYKFERCKTGPKANRE